jgi:hypothetical protein
VPFFGKKLGLIGLFFTLDQPHERHAERACYVSEQTLFVGENMTLKYLIIGLCAGLLAGCNSGGTKVTNAEMIDLLEVGKLLRIAARQTGTAPAQLSDLEPFKTKYLEAYNGVKSGDFVVLWETPIETGGDGGEPEMVVAYGKDVPTNGGYVLTSAGKVTKMSPAEFASAPRAKK